MLDALLKNRYHFHRLIFINSCGHAYTELELDHNLVMTGDNNVGKTSSLSAIKLFLLPEVTFTNAAKKFDFKSGNREFSGLDSFLYYFPHNSSFIVLEAENPHGCFCTILSRSTQEQGYARTFVARPYSEIRDYFWEFEDGGIGQQRTALTRESLKAALEPLKPLYKADMDTIKQAIYQEEPINPKLGRYCLVPLPENGTRREVNALRSLVHMIFDASQAKGSSLPGAIATIIEGTRRSSKERLSANLSNIIAEYNGLTAESDRMVRLQDNKALWQSATESRKRFETALLHVAQRQTDLNAAMASEIADCEKQIAANGPEREQVGTAVSTAKRCVGEAQAQVNRCEGEKRGLASRLKELREKISRVHACRKEYPSFNDEAIIDALKAHLDEQRSRLEALNDEGLRQRRWSDLTAAQKRDQARYDQLAGRLASTQSITIGRLSAHARNVLHSLSTSFAEAQINLDASQTDTLESFASQCEEVNGVVHWLGTPLREVVWRPFDLQASRLEWEQESRQLTNNLSDYASELKELQEMSGMTVGARDNEHQRLEKEIQKTEQDIRLFSAYEQNQIDEDQVKRDDGELETDLDIKKEQLVIDRQALSDLQDKHERLNAQLRHYEVHKQSLTENQRRLAEHSLASLEGFSALISQLLPQPINALEIESVMNEVLASASAVDESYRVYDRQIRQLVRAKVVEGLPVAMADRDDLLPEDLHHALETLSADFSNLEQLQRNHEDNIDTHNQTTSTTISELEANRDAIQIFENQINEEFKHYHISDLSEIKVKIGLDQRFCDLLDEVSQRHRSALGEATLAGKGFYDDLSAFVNDFFTTRQGTDTLNLHHIIQSVEFSYKKHDGKVEDKGQSTGTTSMFVAVLLSILIHRLLPGGTELHMPLVMDEVANLDANNLQTLLDVLEKHRFKLFSATPEISGLLAHKIGRWVEIGTLRAPNTLMPDCTCVWMEEANALMSVVPGSVQER